MVLLIRYFSFFQLARLLLLLYNRFHNFMCLITIMNRNYPTMSFKATVLLTPKLMFPIYSFSLVLLMDTSIATTILLEQEPLLPQATNACSTSSSLSGWHCIWLCNGSIMDPSLQCFFYILEYKSMRDDTQSVYYMNIYQFTYFSVFVLYVLVDMQDKTIKKQIYFNQLVWRKTKCNWLYICWVIPQKLGDQCKITIQALYSINPIKVFFNNHLWYTSIIFPKLFT